MYADLRKAAFSDGQVLRNAKHRLITACAVDLRSRNLPHFRPITGRRLKFLAHNKADFLIAQARRGVIQ